jgi:hypothetical protein
MKYVKTYFANASMPWTLPSEPFLLSGWEHDVSDSSRKTPSLMLRTEHIIRNINIYITIHEDVGKSLCSRKLFGNIKRHEICK